MPNIRGQHTINYLYHILVVLTDVFAFIAGIALKNVKAILYIHVFGILMTMLIIVPDWKFWNRPALKDVVQSSVQSKGK
ncbi:Microsomal_signal peptidase 12kDa subunit [Hexamita inflata]|uniref:Microsomal_signal peptidase 12kDa subunit n=1 Tax=Hexamita inflata TaxID=28002 RepID=A0ABP1HCG7_9EUKA